MKKILQKIRNNKKGFTLVEILVVLVILAIIAAASIPTMIGFINEARGKSYVAQARTVYVAAQAAVTEQYGIDKSAIPTTVTETSTNNVGTTMASMLGTDVDGATYTVTIDATTAKVTMVKYVQNGWTVTMDITNGTVTATD